MTTGFRIATQTTETATGAAAEAFKRFPPQIGVPRPLLLLSGSPGLFDAQMGFIGHYREHPRLGFPVLAGIRFLASRHLKAPDCLEFNRKLLHAAGMAAEEIETLPAAGGDFTQAERLIMDFALRVVAQPGGVGDGDVDALRAAGWQDSDILDAAYQAATMQVPAVLLGALSQR